MTFVDDEDDIFNNVREEIPILVDIKKINIDDLYSKFIKGEVNYDIPFYVVLDTIIGRKKYTRKFLMTRRPYGFCDGHVYDGFDTVEFAAEYLWVWSSTCKRFVSAHSPYT